MSDPALMGIVIVFVIACIPAGLLALPVIATIIRLKNLESRFEKTAEQLPASLVSRIAELERWVEAREALAKHVTAQAQHRNARSMQ